MASLADVSRAILATARSAPKLDDAAQRALIAKHQADGDTDAADQIALANLRTVLSTADRLKGYGLPLDDLVQEGCCGVMLAARAFDPERGVPFSAYARLWAKAEMQEFVLRNWSIVRVPKGSAEASLFFRMRSLRAEIAAQHPDMTSAAVNAEIAFRYGVPLEEVEAFHARSSGDRSLNTPVGTGEDDETEFGDLLEADTVAPEIMLDDDQLAADLTAAMATLDDHERFVMQQRWLTDEIAPLSLLAEWFDLTVPKVRAIEFAALGKLKRRMMERLPRSVMQSKGHASTAQ